MKICEKYTYGQGVLTYLARYLRGGPIANRRIVAVSEESVTFNCGRERKQLLTLPLGEFLYRYVQHIAQPNAVWVRSYGLYSPTQKEELAWCREILGQAAWEDPEPLEWQQRNLDQSAQHEMSNFNILRRSDGLLVPQDCLL